MCKMDILKHYGFVVGSPCTQSNSDPTTPPTQQPPNNTTNTNATHSNPSTVHTAIAAGDTVVIVEVPGALSASPPLTPAPRSAAAVAEAALLAPLVAVDQAAAAVGIVGIVGCRDCDSECSTCGSSRVRCRVAADGSTAAAATAAEASARTTASTSQIPTESRQVTDV